MPTYRCHYHPTDRDGLPVPCDSGVLPYVQVQAASAEQAQRLAHKLKQAPIAQVERFGPPRDLHSFSPRRSSACRH